MVDASKLQPGIAPSPETALWAAHVRWAQEGDTIYILDLRRDAYMSLPRGAWAAKAGELRDRGLVGECRASPAPLGRAPPRHGVVAVWSALLWARHVLRRRQLECASGFFADIGGADDAALAQRIGEFVRLRPLYPRAASCLFDSLALGRFLLHAGIRTELVFGVRGGPFAAHAWLQKEGRIVNDDAEYCAGFTPMRAP